MGKTILISIILLLVASNLFAQELPEEVYELANIFHREQALTFVSRDTLHSMQKSGDWSYYRLGIPYFSYTLQIQQCKNIKTAPGVLNIAYIDCVYFPVIVDENYVRDRRYRYYEEDEKWRYNGGPIDRSLLTGTIDNEKIKCIDNISLVTIVDHKIWFLIIECDNDFYVRKRGSFFEKYGKEGDDCADNPLIPFEEAWPIILDSFPKKRPGG
jgi:hypothetical protein